MSTLFSCCHVFPTLNVQKIYIFLYLHLLSFIPDTYFTPVVTFLWIDIINVFGKMCGRPIVTVSENFSTKFLERSLLHQNAFLFEVNNIRFNRNNSIKILPSMFHECSVYHKSSLSISIISPSLSLSLSVCVFLSFSLTLLWFHSSFISQLILSHFHSSIIYFPLPHYLLLKFLAFCSVILSCLTNSSFCNIFTCNNISLTSFILSHSLPSSSSIPLSPNFPLLFSNYPFSLSLSSCCVLNIIYFLSFYYCLLSFDYCCSLHFNILLTPIPEEVPYNRETSTVLFKNMKLFKRRIYSADSGYKYFFLSQSIPEEICMARK